MKRHHWIGLLLIVLLIIGFILARQTEPSDSDVLKIGALAVLSGDAAAWGQNAQKGFDLAVKEVNERGGVRGKKVELIYEDTAADPKRAVTGFKKLVGIDRVDAVLGPLFQTEVSAVSPIVGSTITVTPSYAPFPNRPNPKNPLLIWLDPTIEAERMADYVRNQKIQDVSVLGTYDSWEREVAEGFADKIQGFGSRMLAMELIATDATDLKTTITKLISQKPDAIFLGTYYQFIPAVKSLKELGYQGRLYSIEVDSYLVEETRPLSNGLQFIAPDYYSDAFVKKFETAYGQKPGIPSGQAYDATNILLSFFEKYDSKEEILRAMEEFKEYDGVSGHITTTNDNRTLLPTAIFEIQNGEIVKLPQ